MLADLASAHGEDLLRPYRSTHATTAVAKFDDDAQQNVEQLIDQSGAFFTPKERLSIGLGGGLCVGTGVGLIFGAARAAAAADHTGIAAALVTVGYSLIGVGGGMLFAGKVVGGVTVPGVGGIQAVSGKSA